MLGTVDFHDPRTFKVHLAVIQPTPFCNIDCAYCYLPNRNLNRRMTDEILEQACRFLFAQPERLADELVVAWHAGEPLTLPIQFYRSAFSIMQELAPSSVQVTHSFQTNATLISQEWCDLIRQWNVHLGVSLDGPEFLHDGHRVDRAGRGTFDRVMRGVALLRRNDIPFSTIAVLSQESLDYAEELWDFFRHLGVRDLAFNCESIESQHSTSSLADCSSPARVHDFFEKLLELRDTQDPAVRIRELDYFVEGIPHWQRSFRRIENVPLSILGIAWNGDISTFSPELVGVSNAAHGDFIFGNVASSSLDTILENPRFVSVFRDISAGISKCRTECEYFRVCGGGSPSAKLSENGTFDSTETLSCRLHIKCLADLVFSALEKKRGHGGNEGLNVGERLDRLLASELLVPARAAGVSS
ncbi:MAG TPA: cyclophane-forming radical SAM/SPASM peptide maturase GrrM/OscB [Candidatus Angelobacter sp.]|nr:cyclophane-forming radical SAM/SPASM peptide maturase GrrM/OscB [Candidatus Angelobacter sp.]